MYLKVNDGFSDSELQHLSELLYLLDERIMEVSRLIDSANDPESDGLLDRGEYFIGVGVTAIQQYLVDTLTFTGVEKKQAFDLGPNYSEKYSFVAVLNAAANWWKHSAEWCSNTKLRKDALRTQQIVAQVSESEDYALSNVLAGLLRTPNITLCALLPNLVLWRSAVEQKCH